MPLCTDYGATCSCTDSPPGSGYVVPRCAKCSGAFPYVVAPGLRGACSGSGDCCYDCSDGSSEIGPFACANNVVGGGGGAAGSTPVLLLLGVAVAGGVYLVARERGQRAAHPVAPGSQVPSARYGRRMPATGQPRRRRHAAAAG